MASALPTHPTLVHPRTGDPIRAVYVSPRTGRIWWPVIGAQDDAPPAVAVPKPGPPPTQAPTMAPPPEPGFPPGTPVEQMTVEQREAYWKHQARKHEERVKSLGNVTGEQLAGLREKAAKHDALEAELASDSEKAAKKAADDAKAATRAEVEPQLIAAYLDAAAARAGVSENDLSRAVEFLDAKKFITSDGSIDTDKVKAFVATITPAKGEQKQRNGPTLTAHGPAGRGGGSVRTESGDELYDRLHPRRTA